MKQILLKITDILILPFCLLFFTSCSYNDESGIKKIKLSEVTRSVFYAPQYIAMELDFFTQEGIQVELSTADGSDKSMTAVLSSQADISLLGSSTVISVHAQGKENAPILFAGLTQRDGSFLVGRTPDFSWEQLLGKEIIAGRKGGVPEMVLEYILKNHNINPDTDVKLLNNIQFNLMSAAFSRGIGDYVALFEPTASMLVREKNFYILKALGKECNKICYTGYCCSQGYLEKNLDTIKSFIRAIYKSQVWLKSHSAEEIARVISPYFLDANISLLTDCIENYLQSDVWCDNPLISCESFDLMQDIMINSNELKHKVEFNKMVKDDYALEVVDCING